MTGYKGSRRPGFMVWGLDPPGRRPLEAMIGCCRANLAQEGKQCDENGMFPSCRPSAAAEPPCAPRVAVGTCQRRPIAAIMTVVQQGS